MTNGEMEEGKGITPDQVSVSMVVDFYNGITSSIDRSCCLGKG